MKDLKEVNRMQELQAEVAKEKDIAVDTLRRLLAKVEEYSEYERPRGLHDDMLNILKDEYAHQSAKSQSSKS